MGLLYDIFLVALLVVVLFSSRVHPSRLTESNGLEDRKENFGHAERGIDKIGHGYDGEGSSCGDIAGANPNVAVSSSGARGNGYCYGGGGDGGESSGMPDVGESGDEDDDRHCHGRRNREGWENDGGNGGNKGDCKEFSDGGVGGDGGYGGGGGGGGSGNSGYGWGSGFEGITGGGGGGGGGGGYGWGGGHGRK